MATKLEQQIEKVLAVLAAHTKPVRYIVRKPRKGGKARRTAGLTLTKRRPASKLRPAGKGRAPGGGVTVNTRPYVSAHGHEPRGYGLWVFDFDGAERLDAPGPYARAIGDARRYAAGRGYATITVLP